MERVTFRHKVNDVGEGSKLVTGEIYSGCVTMLKNRNDHYMCASIGALPKSMAPS